MPNDTETPAPPSNVFEFTSKGPISSVDGYGKPSPAPFSQTITISDWAASADVSVPELTLALRQISKLATYMLSGVLRVYAESTKTGIGAEVGSASPISAALYNISSQAENAAHQLDQATRPQILAPGNGGGGGNPFGRA